jgi:hypothetical protein
MPKMIARVTQSRMSIGQSIAAAEHELDRYSSQRAVQVPTVPRDESPARYSFCSSCAS